VAALLALLSSVMWGGADFLGGLMSRRLPALVVVAASQLVALLVVLPIAVVSGGFARPTGYLPWGVAAGIVGCLALTSFYYALSIGTMGIVSPLSATGIVVPVVVGLATGDHPNWLEVGGIVAAGVGVVLAGGPDVRSGDQATGRHGPRPVIFALLAALGFGFTLVALSYGGRVDPLMTVVAQRTASGLLIGIPVMLVAGRHVLRRSDTPMLVTVGIGDVAANATYAWSASLGALTVTAVLGSLFPVTTLLLARTFLHERLSRLQGVGVVVALVGVVLLGAGSALSPS
jgi:drug/metabolite transporter (DMT)-like permease